MIIGPTFGDEIIAAGLGGLPFSWNTLGDINYSREITPEQKTAIEAVLAAHDPTAKRVTRKELLTAEIRNALTLADIKTVLEKLL